MSVSTMLRPTLVFAAAVMLCNPADAAKLTAKAVGAGTLFQVDTVTGAVTDLGFSGLNGVQCVKRHPNTALWGLQPGILNGYTVVSIDEQTGATNALNAFTSTSSGCYGMAIDPTGNLVYATATKGLLPTWDLVELNLSSGVATTRSFGSFGGGVRSLAYGPDGNLYALHIDGTGTTKLLVVNTATPASSTVVGTHLGAAFDGSNGVEMVRDVGDGKTYAYSRATKMLFDLDLSTGLASNSIALQTGADLFTLAGSGCGGSFLDYGVGCPGSGGFVPNLSASGAPCEGNSISISIDQGLGGSMATLLLGLTTSNLPLGGGCNLLAFPLLPGMITFPLFGAGPGQGSIVINAQVPTGLAGFPLVIQSYVIDPNATLGAAFSDGVVITFG